MAMSEALCDKTMSGRVLSGDEDADLLATLGYEQELARSWDFLQNFGASFSIISVVTGITTLFGNGLVVGGPGVMTIGWIIVSFFTIFVALSMAEIVSAVPTSGGPYYWAAVLAPPKYSALAAWITGWYNLLGQVAVTTGITFGCASLITTLATVHGGFQVTAGNTLAIYAGLLISHGTFNTFGVKLLRYFNNLSILLHSAGVFAIVIAVIAGAPKLQSAKFVFATFYDGTGDPGWSIRQSPAYVAICGILLAQYTITGFDASAHMSEETANATKSAPLGVLTSVAVSAVFGFFYLVCLLFSIQDFDRTVNSKTGQPVLQIFLDIFGDAGATALMSVIIICVWHCGLFSLTSNSRMMFAFSRDGALPAIFHHVDPKFQSPYRSVWLAVILSFCLALPSMGSTVAFSAATSIATIGLYISYGVPIMLGLIWSKNFKKGPFNLRGFSRPIGLIACLWIGFVSVVFTLPTVDPVTSQTLNYTAAAVGVIAIWAIGSWALWAHRWFAGPVRRKEVGEIMAGGRISHDK